MKKINIEQMIEDLYTLEPNFRSDPNFPNIVRELVAARPEAKADPNFVKTLRAELIARSEGGAAYSVRSPFMRWLKVGAPIFAALLLLVVAGRSGFIGRDRGDDGEQLAFTTAYVEREAQAFGTFAPESGMAPALGSRDAMSSTMAAGKGGAMESASMPAFEGADADRMATSMIYPYPMTQYVYEYKGDTGALNSAIATVLKRQTGIAASANLISTISKAKFGGINLASFRDLEMQNLQVAENRPGGYSVNIDFIGGYIYLGKNWKFGNPYPLENAGPAPRIEDAEAIRIANAFLSSHSISASNYGNPVVEQMPEMMPLAAAAEDAALSEMPVADKMMYMPDMVTVVYPLEIDGTKVHEEGGQVYGLRVTINTRTKEVDSVGELGTQSYERSTYTVAKDTNRLVDFLNKRSEFPVEAGTEIKKETITLGTPSIVYMRYWKYDESNGQSSEFLVPAAAFPVTAGGETYYSKTVIVPIVEDFLVLPNYNDPVYRIMEEDKAAE